jgi:hypothetical protein
MSGTSPKVDQGSCEERSCQRPFGHRDDHYIRTCERDGCDRRTRNADERRCVVHEDHATYEHYQAIIEKNRRDSRGCDDPEHD